MGSVVVFGLVSICCSLSWGGHPQKDLGYDGASP